MTRFVTIEMASKSIGLSRRAIQSKILDILTGLKAR